MRSKKFNIAIIGVGLIGGSLALALKESALINKIIGIDPCEKTISKALEIGAIDQGTENINEVEQADIVFLACPLHVYPDVLRKIAPKMREKAILTDVGSTKKKVMHLFEDSLPEHVEIIGGHPMAGAEMKGIEGADRYLFENAVYVLTPGRNTSDETLDLLSTLLQESGAKIKIMDADRHDELVASISHIPHIAAVALVNLTQDDDEKLMLTAGGFRDTTRVASSNPGIWEEILMSNQEHVLEQINSLIGELETIKNAIKCDDRSLLKHQLEKARNIRERIPKKRKGLLAEFAEIVCIVPDKPGIIGTIGVKLAEQDINIVDIEILRVREGDGGTIRLGFATIGEAEKAVEVLKLEDIKAWLR